MNLEEIYKQYHHESAEMNKLIHTVLPNYNCEDTHSNTFVTQLRNGVPGFPISIFFPRRIVHVKNKKCYMDAVRLAHAYNYNNPDSGAHYSVRESYLN